MKRWKLKVLLDLATKEEECISDAAWIDLRSRAPFLSSLPALNEAKKVLDKILDKELPITSTEQYSYIPVIFIFLDLFFFFGGGGLKNFFHLSIFR